MMLVYQQNPFTLPQNKQITDYFKMYEANIPDTQVICQSKLDVTHKSRTSLFPWRGQFSPGLIELLLDTFSDSATVVCDPFVGSGTTLFEAARKSLSSYGADINPAAVIMATSVELMTRTHPQREHLLHRAAALVEKYFPSSINEGLFSQLEGDQPLLASEIARNIAAMLQDADDPMTKIIIKNSVLRSCESSDTSFSARLHKALAGYRQIALRLPYNATFSHVFHCDARTLKLGDHSVDLILTSPPYINVFNYHQNHRSAMEILGWNVLEIAKSEFGSNRKHRGNRFLTIVQYCLDMSQALLEMRRVLSPTGRIILVVGRESMVRGIAFPNGKIIATLASGAANFDLILRQERKFRNKFGKLIYEDILHFSPTRKLRTYNSRFPYDVATTLLAQAADQCSAELSSEIAATIYSLATVRPSPYFQ